MRKKISVIGERVQIAQELSRIAEVGADLRGADVVVLAGDADLAQIARSAPAAAVIVSGDAVEQRCQATYDATLFPRGRIVGVPDARDVVGIVESIVLERDDAHEVVAMTDGQFGRCSAKLGRGGIREFIAPRTSLSAS